MIRIGRRSVGVYILGLSLLIAACSGMRGEESSRQRPVQLFETRTVETPVSGSTVTPFAPPTGSTDPGESEGGEGEGTPVPSPTPPTTPGASPTPITPQPTGAAPTAIAAGMARADAAVQAGGAATAQVEVVVVTPAPDGSIPGVAAGGQTAVEDLPQVTVVVTAEPDGELALSDAFFADLLGGLLRDGGLTADARGLLVSGAEIYAQRCAACHGPDGIGRREYFPNLRGNPFVTVEDPTGVVEVILNGRNLMPPFRQHLSDEEVAAVTSYIRMAWGHEAEPVRRDEVTQIRQAETGQPQ